MKTWYNNMYHRNALISIEETDDGWNVRHYWRQFTSGTLQREVSNLVTYKEWFKTEKEVLGFLASNNYVKSERQDYTT